MFDATLKFYNAAGTVIDTIPVVKGLQQIKWHPHNTANGSYYIQLANKNNTVIATKKSL